MTELFFGRHRHYSGVPFNGFFDDGKSALTRLGDLEKLRMKRVLVDELQEVAMHQKLHGPADFGGRLPLDFAHTSCVTRRSISA